jgi:hypothetical protein
MTECTLGGNTPKEDFKDVRVEDKGTLVINRCTLGDTTFENKNMVEGVGSLLGEGSVSMVMSILALAASAASIGVSIALYKKKTLPVADNAEEDDE